MPYDPCAFCGGMKLSLDCAISLRGQMNVDVARCWDCGLLFVNPVLVPEQIAALYDAGYWDPDPPGRGALDAYRRYPRHYRFGAAYGRRLSRTSPTGRMLEIGCGLPFFLKGVAEHCDWEVEGIDAAAGISRFARDKLGLKVTEAPFGAGAFPARSFDLVRAKDVIEHVPRPMAFLAGIRQVLRPGGRVELWLPNGPLDLAAARGEYKRGGRAVMGAGHILFISPRVLRAMLKQSGFQVGKHTVSGFRYALKALGLLKGRAGPAVGGRAQAPGPVGLLSSWQAPAPERGPKGTVGYAAYREWRSYHPALPWWLPLGSRQRIVARNAPGSPELRAD